MDAQGGGHTKNRAHGLKKINFLFKVFFEAHGAPTADLSGTAVPTQGKCEWGPGKRPVSGTGSQLTDEV